jgi:hypothetical protein
MIPLIELFEHEGERFRGITGWDDLQHLGRTNMNRLVELARDRINAALAEGRADDVRERAGAIDALGTIAAGCTADLPMLPRIRVELFRLGMPVRIFLGDSPGSLSTGWADDRVTHLAKGFRSEWSTGRGNSGWFWEVTAEASQELFPRQRSVRFSTTEPRVLPDHDLGRVRDAPPHFRRVFCQNAWREWHPLWCIDRGVGIDVARVDFEAWLKDA